MGDIIKGLKYDSDVHCDELVSLSKTMLTNYIGILGADKLYRLEKALKIALQLNN